MNLYCQNDGYHQDEPLEMICLSPECISSGKLLNCVVCLEEHHQGHQVIHYQKFLKLLQQNGHQLKTDIELNQGEEDNLISKYEQLITQLNTLQNAINDQVNKQKELIERKKNILQKFSSVLPTYDIFQNAIRTKDISICQKLIAQFFRKIEYNQKKSEFLIRQSHLIDKSEETEGENELFRKLTDSLNLFRGSSRLNSFDMNYQTYTSLRSQNYIISRKSGDQFLNNIKNRSNERSPSPSPSPLDDKISVSQSLSQYYFKPKMEQVNILKPKTPMVQSLGPINFGYQYHNEYFGEGVQVLPRIAKLVIDGDKRLVLIKPPITGFGVTREQTIKLLIKVCKNTNQRYPMAVGICDQQKAKANKFIFQGFAEHIPGPGKAQDHGTYLLNSNGYIRSQIKDMMKSNPTVRFYSNSIIEMTFKPFHKLLVINRDSSVQVSIPLEIKDNQKMYFCIRLADLNDCVEIVQ